ncbi:hypothetical protein MY4038_002774 [Beauveria bassiana]
MHPLLALDWLIPMHRRPVYSDFGALPYYEL